MFSRVRDAIPPRMFSRDLLQSPLIVLIGFIAIPPDCLNRIYCNPSLYVFRALSLAKA